MMGTSHAFSLSFSYALSQSHALMLSVSKSQNNYESTFIMSYLHIIIVSQVYFYLDHLIGSFLKLRPLIHQVDCSFVKQPGRPILANGKMVIVERIK